MLSGHKACSTKSCYCRGRNQARDFFRGEQVSFYIVSQKWGLLIVIRSEFSLWSLQCDAHVQYTEGSWLEKRIEKKVAWSVKWIQASWSKPQFLKAWISLSVSYHFGGILIIHTCTLYMYHMYFFSNFVPARNRLTTSKLWRCQTGVRTGSQQM